MSRNDRSDLRRRERSPVGWSSRVPPRTNESDKRHREDDRQGSFGRGHEREYGHVGADNYGSKHRRVSSPPLSSGQFGVNRSSTGLNSNTARSVEICSLCHQRGHDKNYCVSASISHRSVPVPRPYELERANLGRPKFPYSTESNRYRTADPTSTAGHDARSPETKRAPFSHRNASALESTHSSSGLDLDTRLSPISSRALEEPVFDRDAELQSPSPHQMNRSHDLDPLNVSTESFDTKRDKDRSSKQKSRDSSKDRESRASDRHHKHRSHRSASSSSHKRSKDSYLKELDDLKKLLKEKDEQLQQKEQEIGTLKSTIISSASASVVGDDETGYREDLLSSTMAEDSTVDAVHGDIVENENTPRQNHGSPQVEHDQGQQPNEPSQMESISKESLIDERSSDFFPIETTSISAAHSEESLDSANHDHALNEEEEGTFVSDPEQRFGVISEVHHNHAQEQNSSTVEHEHSNSLSQHGNDFAVEDQQLTSSSTSLEGLHDVTPPNETKEPTTESFSNDIVTDAISPASVSSQRDEEQVTEETKIPTEVSGRDNKQNSNHEMRDDQNKHHEVDRHREKDRDWRDNDKIRENKSHDSDRKSRSSRNVTNERANPEKREVDRERKEEMGAPLMAICRYCEHVDHTSDSCTYERFLLRYVGRFPLTPVVQK